MRNRVRATARAGFTLIEVLVTLVLLALLLGVIVPQVINQLDRGDPTRVYGDLQSIQEGAKMFRIDVKRYPKTLEQLTENPYNGTDYITNWSDSASLPNGGNINTSLKEKWNGPYIEGELVADVTTDSIETALGGTIDPVFTVSTSTDFGGVEYLVIHVHGLTTEDIQNIDAEYDDGDGGAGRIRETGAGPYVLDYYAVPLR